jgi:hypothetical protein
MSGLRSELMIVKCESWGVRARAAAAQGGHKRPARVQNLWALETGRNIAPGPLEMIPE